MDITIITHISCVYLACPVVSPVLMKHHVMTVIFRNFLSFLLALLLNVFANLNIILIITINFVKAALMDVFNAQTVVTA